MIQIIERDKEGTISSTQYIRVDIVNTVDGYSVVLIPASIKEQELILATELTKSKAVLLALQLESLIGLECHTIEINN
jgi:hypothetical protein